MLGHGAALLQRTVERTVAAKLDHKVTTVIRKIAVIDLIQKRAGSVDDSHPFILLYKELGPEAVREWLGLES